MILRFGLLGCIAVGALGLTAVEADSATLTGSVSLQITNATVSGTDDGSGGLSDLTIAGDFGTLNTLSSTTKVIDAWRISGAIDYADPALTTPLSETGAANQSWANLTSGFLDAPTTSLFTFVAFFNNMVNTAIGGGGTGTGTGSIGGAPVEWEVFSVIVDDPPPIPVQTSGSFSLTVTDDIDDFFATMGEFLGTPRDIAGVTGPAGSPFALNLTVSQIPLPASLPLLLGGMGVFGLVAWRRRTRAAA